MLLRVHLTDYDPEFSHIKLELEINNSGAIIIQCSRGAGKLLLIRE